MSKALVIIKSMGIGDLCILIPNIHAISNKLGLPVTVLTQKNTRADLILKHDPHVKEVIILDEKEIKGFFSIIKKIKPKNFDHSYIYSDSIRLYLVSKISEIKEIFSYKFFSKKGKNFFTTAKEFTEKILNTKINFDPKIYCNHDDIKEAEKKYSFSKEFKHICIGLSASGPTKRWDIERFIATFEKISESQPCKFYLAGGAKDILLIKKFINSSVGKDSISFENMSINETLPIISNCDLYVGNDTGWLHLSCGLGLKCVALFMDSPVLAYGKYSKKISVIVPKNSTEQTTVHNTRGKDLIFVDQVVQKIKDLIN